MPTTKPASHNDAGDTARYIERLARELRTMAAGVDLQFLAYLLAMVEDEAANSGRRLGAKRSKIDS